MAKQPAKACPLEEVVGKQQEQADDGEADEQGGEPPEPSNQPPSDDHLHFPKEGYVQMMACPGPAKHQPLLGELE